MCFISGKGHLKLTLTEYDPDKLFHNRGNITRIKRKDGIGSKQMFRENGVRKVQVLASVEGIPENYSNVRTILQKVDISQVMFKFTGDLKMLNIVAGLMSCSATHPCVYCEAGCSQGEWTDGESNLRTYGNIMQHFEEWTVDCLSSTFLTPQARV